jgi:dTDP-4-dehydrorhamnose 3,5-epimerase
VVAPLSVERTNLEGLWRVYYKLIPDERGSVMEFFRASEFEAVGLPSLGERPQINAPVTVHGAIRGIHAEAAHKFVGVVSGVVHAVIVDLRPDSPTEGRWLGFRLTRGEGLFVSSGLGNSFQTTSDEPSVYLYLFAEEWRADMPGVKCNPLDSELGIVWPIMPPIISEQDRNHPSLAKVLSR